MIENNFINSILTYRNNRKIIRIKIAKNIIKILLYLFKFLYNLFFYKNNNYSLLHGLSTP